MPSSGLPIPSCSAKISAFLRILLIFPAVPNSPPKNAAEKTAKNSSFHITIIIFKVTVLRHAIMAAPRAPRGRFRWTEDYEKELRFAFSFVDTMKKLPTLSQIDENIVNCPTLSVRFQAGHVSRSAMKKLPKLSQIDDNIVKSPISSEQAAQTLSDRRQHSELSHLKRSFSSRTCIPIRYKEQA